MEPQIPKSELARALVFVTRGNNKTVRYILTNEDYLTLLRAVEFEGEPRDGVAWTLLQRFAFLYPQFRSFTDFIRAYAQPINPLWFPNGVKHVDWVRTLVSKGKTAEAEDEKRRAAKRVQYAATPLEKISSTTKDVVDTVFNLGVSPVPGAVHYRAPTIAAKTVDEAKAARDAFAAKHYLSRPVEYGNVLKHNWFWTSTTSASFRIQTLLAEISDIGRALFIVACYGSLTHFIYQTWKNYHG
jgi:hypothetical protein